MSILAKNMKTIRKELKCTQSVMGDILKVGFRTYVRYEAGERDAPVSVLVKLARLGNVSLERLLTAELDRNDIITVPSISKTPPATEVKSANFQTGQVSLRKPAKQEVLTLDDSERKMLTLFRKMDADLQKAALEGFGKKLEGKRPQVRKAAKKAVKKKVVKKKKAVKKKVKVKKKAAPKKPVLKGTRRKGRPGRKRLDRKALKEKIDKLKMVTRSIQKITVR